MFALVEAAGWPIWFLILASVIAVGLIVERLVFLRSQRISPPALLNEVGKELKLRGVSDGMLAKLAASSPLGRIFAAGLKNLNGSHEVLRESIEEAGRSVRRDMERFLTSLGTIASISPLLGLFGTVVGMIEIFGSQAPGGTNPQQLAHGISIALYNTAAGIAISIPSLIFYRHFKNKVDGFVVQMEQAASKLIDIVHGERTEVGR